MSPPPRNYLTDERTRRYVSDYVYLSFIVAVMLIWATVLVLGGEWLWRWVSG